MSIGVVVADAETQKEIDSVYYIIKKNMPFAKYCVIDNRLKAVNAVSLIREASCIFLMGGNATLQFRLMCDKGILDLMRFAEVVL